MLGGMLAGVAPMLPMLLDSATAQIGELEAETIDEALLNVAALCLAARSVDAVPGAAIMTLTVEKEPELVVAGDVAEVGPSHNED